MAEVNTTATKTDIKGPGVKKGKKLSTRVDLTPMVDLGFLLITFFMFTTSMSRLTSMKLKMPDDNHTIPQAIKKSLSRTILLGDQNRLYTYEGILKADLSNVQLTDYRDIRQGILAKKSALSNPEDLFIIIMPGNNCTYKNIIDILDELSIDGVQRYALVNKVDPQYSGFIEKMDRVANRDLPPVAGAAMQSDGF